MSQSLPSAAARWDRLKAPIATAAILGTATVALHFRDPHAHGSWGYCPSYYVFGVYCPGCGGLRAVNDLSNGDVAAAAHSNLLFVASLPLIAGLFAFWIMRAWTGGAPRLSRRTRGRAVWAYAGIAVVFAIVRNLPIGRALVP